MLIKQPAGSQVLKHLVSDQHKVQTFPDKDSSIDSVVEDETLSGLQSLLRERILLCNQGHLYVPTCIRHLRQVKTEGPGFMFLF